MSTDFVDTSPTGQAPPSPGGVAADRPVRATLRAVLLALVAAAALLALAVGAAALRAGSFGAGVALLAGDYLHAGPATLTLSGAGTPSKEVFITNLSSKPIHIVGYNATCSCVKVANLPLTLDPHQRKPVTLHAESAVSQDVSVVFLSDAAEQSYVQVMAKVVADAGAGAPPAPRK